MVLGVRLGGRSASERAHRWVGPPPLLIGATVLGLVVAPFVSHDPEPVQVGATAAATTSLHAISPRQVEPHVIRKQVVAGPPSRAGTVSRGIRPVRLKPVRVGVASFNMFRKLSDYQARSDARALTTNDSIDVIGWQEADFFGSVLHSLAGWDTKTFQRGSEIAEVAVSWRRSEFSLVSAHLREVASGVSYREGRYPFGNRYVAVVTLRHRDSGRTLTVIDTHLPQKIEDPDRPGHWLETKNTAKAQNQLQRIAAMWRSAPGRWVVGTGDYNFDADADAREHPADGPSEVLSGVARSTYQLLGTDLIRTHVTGRHIDYVWLDHRDDAEGSVKATRQWVVPGLNSDHNALVARLVLD